MRVSTASYPVVPDGPAQRITTHETTELRTVRIRAHGAKLPENRVYLQFALESVLGVEKISFDNESILVTWNSEFKLETVCVRVCDRLIRAIGWKHHNTTIDDKTPDWFAHPGATSM